MLSLAECPVCRARISWTYIWRPLWAQWHCKHCGSLLGINRARRLMLIVVMVPAATLVFPLLMRCGLPPLLALPFAFATLIGVLIALLLLIDRPRVIERCGLRCKRCGYDLRGQSEPRCPECGAQLDAEQQAALKTGDVPVTTKRRPRMLWPLLGLLIIFSIASLVFVFLMEFGRIRRAAPLLPTTQSTSAPQTQPSAQRPISGP